MNIYRMDRKAFNEELITKMFFLAHECQLFMKPHIDGIKMSLCFKV